jgi:outer membrane protein assembly factor BamA
LVAREDSVTVGWHDVDETDYEYETSDYRIKWGIDFVAAGVSFSPEFGEVGNGAQLALSDILGNHRIYLVAGNTSEGFDNFWRRMNAAVTYVNLSRRLHYSLGVFHLNNTREDPVALGVTERRYGGSVGVSLPLDMFRRIEAFLVLQQFQRGLTFDATEAPLSESFLGTVFLTYVSDKTLWTIGGPLTGWRWYVRAGRTHDFLDRGFSSTSTHFDVRRYFKITQRIVFANRFHYNSVWGGSQQLFYLGGPWDLRGYDFRQFIGRTTYLFNTEIRFPLIDRFALDFPFGQLEIPMFRGAVFMDVGKVTRFIVDSDLLGSFGAGAEINLGYAPVVRVNWTRQTDFRTISARNRWELFIGYNF